MTSSGIYLMLHSMYQLNNKFPSVEEICEKTGCEKKTVEDMLHYFVKNGKLNYINNKYSFPKTEKKKRIMFDVCRVIIGIVALACILCSIRFTYSFNKLTMPKIWGFILSASLIVFTSFCFTVRTYLIQLGKKKQAVLFIVLYLMGVFYSVFTAIAGQYNDYLMKNKHTVEVQYNNKINQQKTSYLQEQKNTYKEQIKNYQKQITAQQKIIDDLSQSPEKKYEYNNTWKNAVYYVNLYNTKIDELNKKIVDVDNELINSVTINSNEDKNIYDWIASLFHISSNLLQFLISLFPAIFIDLVAPFAVSFAFTEKQ